MTELEKKEKKVEYLELIYDLIFVYMVGQNNRLLHHFQNGFIDPSAFMAYVLCTLAIIQIWNYTTFYVNLFGRNSIRDHIFMFINMYLLYFMGQSTRSDWHAYQTQYFLAWGLILVNVGAQYFIELRSHRADEWNRAFIIRMGMTLFIEAAVVLAGAIPTGMPATGLSALAILCGIVLTALSRGISCGGKIDFMHLTERAMLYVVFSFGEMIIAVASYFDGDGSWSWNTIYFSLMAFLIAAGLFLIYGLLYDHVIDREGSRNGMLYMVLHIFIIFFINNITASLEFMREEEVRLLPKILFLIVSFVGYYGFLFSLRGYLKSRYRDRPSIMIVPACVTVLFIVLMFLFREAMMTNILLSVLYVLVMFLLLYREVRKERKQNRPDLPDSDGAPRER